jgi:elongation factor P hydroxylase
VRTLTAAQIADCFNAGLGRRYRVRLLGGAVEPVYEPGSGDEAAVIRYTRDYPASALHELAHWCIAGSRRRALPDYGYWYRPPPRTDAEQAAFFEVELPVQALEARLAMAAGLPFRVSVDDLDRNDTAGRRAAVSRFEADVLRLAGIAAEADSASKAYPFSLRARALEADLAGYRLRVAA